MPTPIKSPAGYTPEFALAYAQDDGDSKRVSPKAPLPVFMSAPSAAAPLTGDADVDELAGPFTPQHGRPVMLVLSGEWEGTVTLKRSSDGGNTLFDLTAGGRPYGTYVRNICEPVWEEAEAGSELYLDIRITSGRISYRMGQ